ncbi:MAG: NAD(+)/NADH kinase [Treponema sp.]|jgi:NAD+ kinase|nr:NAD(+)/NADH kinase [Treponema sp.]
MAAIKRALLVVNLHKKNAKALGEEICAELEDRGVQVRSFTFEKPEGFQDAPYDVAFSLGGDGTVLYTARAVAAQAVPIIPVNLGTLGFIATVRPDNWKTVLGQWETGSALVSRRFMLEVDVERRGKRTKLGPCLNDVVISALGIAKIIRLNVESVVPPLTGADGAEFLRLGEYRSDGLIIATPTGSTAYSVASGGPILEPEMEAIIINPICPFTLSNRPIVLSPREAVIVTVEQEQRSGVLLTIDGQVTEALEPGDRIHVYEAPFPAMLVASGRRAFYEALRTKLAWSIPGTGPGSGASWQAPSGG